MNEYQVHIDNIFDLSDEGFFNLCVKNEKLRFERFDGDVYIMPPTGGATGGINFNLFMAFSEWYKSNRNNYKAFDSSTGFQISEKTVLSPDLAIVNKSKWDKLNENEKTRFLPFTPDFIAEIVSPSDSIHYAEKKIKKWLEYGVKLAWLIIPQKEKVIVYYNDEIKESSKKEFIPGYNVLPNIKFKLEDIL